jgi:hypothetical protein
MLLKLLNYQVTEIALKNKTIYFKIKIQFQILNFFPEE